jgi:hypothetical protein
MKFKELPYLEFRIKEIHEYDRFIKNRKYIQLYKHPDGFTIVDIAIYREDYDDKRYIEFSLHKEIQRYKTDDDDYPDCHYYELVSKKKEIQEAMESRALNIILKNIIGDNTFVW